MKQISPLFSQAATARPRRVCGEGADGHITDAPWPVELTDIGWQYVIPGCERRDERTDQDNPGGG